MDNLSANANDVINVLLDCSKEQERAIAILQVNLQDEINKNKDLQAQLDKLKADKPEENKEDPNK